MCGISGIIYKGNHAAHNTDAIVKMVDVQKHRGPNDQGICGIACGDIKDYSVENSQNCCPDTKILLGHDRLSILDLSRQGHQPMYNDDRSVIIVYNGEVYNAFEEKCILKQRGYSFKSDTDTEVVLKMYQEYGIEETLKRLNGMFAFFLYDLKGEKGYLVRDRFGIKPLYKYEDDRFVVFSSEIKGIVKSGIVSVEVDEQGIQETFAFGNSYRRSIIKGVVPVQPGECIEYNNWHANAFSYFSLNEYMTKRKNGFERTKNLGINLLKKSIKAQMVSDVKVGCQLSGGVDSSLVSYFATRNEEAKMSDSIAIVFEDKYKAYNEERYIDYVSDKLNISCHKKELNGNYYIRNLEKINWHLDNIPAYYNELGILQLSEEANKHVTVLLSGEGADELFAGYTRMAYSGVIYALSRIDKILPEIIKAKIWKGRKGHTYVDYIVFKEAVPLELCKKVFHSYDDYFVAKDRVDYARGLVGDSLDIQRKYEMSVRLQGLLNRQDKSTMANSIENRVPFLDNEIVDWAFELPRSYLIKLRLRDIFKGRGTRIQGKYILKSICGDLFDRSFAFRDKGGFGIPCRDYIKEEHFINYLKEKIIPEINKRGMMDGAIIEKWVDGIDMITPMEENALWRAINLEILCQLLVDGREYGLIN